MIIEEKFTTSYIRKVRNTMEIMLEEKQNIGYYAIIPAAVLYNNELKPNQKILYAVITSLSNKDGYCYATNKYLAEKLVVESNMEEKCLSFRNRI